MGEQKSDVLQGTLDLMVLKTLEAMGPLHGYGIARRIEQVSGQFPEHEPGHHLPRASAAGATRLDQVANGARRKPTAARSSIRSAASGGRRSRKRRRTGSAWRRRWPGSWRRRIRGAPMDWLRTILSRCNALFRRRDLDTDLDEELRAHIDLAIAENVKAGMRSDEARTAALRAFGGVAQTRELTACSADFHGSSRSSATCVSLREHCANLRASRLRLFSRWRWESARLRRYSAW